MNFKLKNYTTGISYRKSVAEIEQYLSLMGATKVMKTYFGDGRISSLTFGLTIEGKDLAFQLPANSDQVFEVLKAQYKRGPRKKQKLQEQAENVSWRIIKDWVYAQLSLIKIGQAKVEQVMLPYMYNGEKTLYEHLRDGGFKFAQLEAPKKS